MKKARTAQHVAPWSQATKELRRLEQRLQWLEQRQHASVTAAAAAGRAGGRGGCASRLRLRLLRWRTSRARAALAAERARRPPSSGTAFVTFARRVASPARAP